MVRECLMADVQTKDARIFTTVVAAWMVLLILFGLLTLLGVFR